MQKIMIALEVPEAVPAKDLAQEVAELLMDTLGAGVSTMRVTSSTESVTL